ncbi:hypothetical protein ACMDCT_15305 [Halomonadaceae bacterium KBTZ08]
MTRHIFRAGLTLLSLAALSGCFGNSESDEFGEDIKPKEGNPEAGEPDTYSARVINGNLDGAFVWLDMDGDQTFSTYDYQEYRDDFLDDEDDESRLGLGPEDFPIEEPWAVTGAQGNVAMDVSSLAFAKTDAPDMEPEAYPLMAIGVPGVTTNGGEIIDRAFFLSAPPGITTVTPFSTLAQAQRWLGDDGMDASQAASRLLQNEVFGGRADVSPYQDYLKLEHPGRLPHYATALRRLMQAQVPERISAQIRSGLGNLDSPTPGEAFFEPHDLRVIGSLALDQAASVIAEVDAAVGDGDPGRYTLPPNNQLDSIRNYQPDLRNPYVAVGQRYYVPGEGADAASGFDPEDPAGTGRLSAQVFLDYALGGELRRIGVRGRTRPSLSAFAFLAGDNGADSGNPVALGHTPYLAIDTGTVLEESLSRDALTPTDLDERFSGEGGSVDWRAPRIGLDSTQFGSDSSASELDGVMERVYVAPGDGGGDSSYELVRRPPGTSGSGARDAALGVSTGPGVTQAPLNLPLWSSVSGSSAVTLDYGSLSDVSGCSGETIQHINKQQTVTVDAANTDSVVEVTRYGHLRAEPDGRLAFRVMAETYPDPNPENEEGGLILREYEYVTDGKDSPAGFEQPDRVRSVRVLAVEPFQPENRWCGGAESNAFAVTPNPAEMRLYVAYGYRRFADYLESTGTEGQ